MAITNPNEIRTNNRRKELSRIRQRKEYRDIVTKRTKDAVCIWCGRPDHLTIHHIHYSDYYSERAYISGLYTGWIMCHRCHRALHRHQILCPKCKQRYTKYEVCWECLSDERKDEITANKRFWKELQRKWRRDQWRKYKQRLKG